MTLSDEGDSRPFTIVLNFLTQKKASASQNNEFEALIVIVVSWQLLGFLGYIVPI